MIADFLIHSLIGVAIIIAIWHLALACLILSRAFRDARKWDRSFFRDDVPEWKVWRARVAIFFEMVGEQFNAIRGGYETEISPLKDRK